MNNIYKKTVLIKGAGDLASGIALRLHHAGFSIVMTEIAEPSTVRRTVAFSRAVREGTASVEDANGELVDNIAAARATISRNNIAVIVDADCEIRRALQPDILIDAIIAKKNLGTTINDAPIVIAAGPGFSAGTDCHAVIETQRGHNLGRVYYYFTEIKQAAPNTGIPGEIAGWTTERLLRSPADGLFTTRLSIGDTIRRGALVAEVTPAHGPPIPIHAEIDGILRGLLPNKHPVRRAMKCGDIDPRCEKTHCFTVSDKALSIAGAALEAILTLQNGE
jgi:xanthine dehydrogenase accessory factor